MGSQGNLDPWSKPVAAIAFTLGEKGEISEVTIRPEGVFLVRLVDLKPAVTRSFESVAATLKRN
ncbi:MAG: peptidylprolyl isomerase, partial [Roseibacillus sp.]